MSSAMAEAIALSSEDRYIIVGICDRLLVAIVVVGGRVSLLPIPSSSLPSPWLERAMALTRTGLQKTVQENSTELALFDGT
jgi:hypothetical protein